MCAVKKKSEDILSAFIIEVSFNAAEATLNNNEDVQMKKSTENNDIVKSTKNNDTVLSTENNNTVKLINYNDLMNTTSESFAHTTTD